MNPLTAFSELTMRTRLMKEVFFLNIFHERGYKGIQ